MAGAAKAGRRANYRWSLDIMPSTFATLPYLPEMREEDAPAPIRRIYADIKRASGTSLVNLVYRHLATIPGGLEWVWGCIRMNWGYDELRRAALAMPHAKTVIHLPIALWRTVGLTHHRQRASIADESESACRHDRKFEFFNTIGLKPTPTTFARQVAD